jgi:hypothetical protein
MKLFTAYQTWAFDNGLKSMTNIGFAKKVNVKFVSKPIRVEKKLHKCFQGIGLIDEGSQTMDFE